MGNEVVFAVAALEARPVGSASGVHERSAFTVLWKAGTVVRVIGRNDIDEARAAAQWLAEEPG
jgi:hypothetical protein